MSNERTTDAAPTPLGRSRTLAPVAIALGLLAAAALLYRDTLALLVERWREPEGAYAHGFLVAALVPWLVWRARERLGTSTRGRIACGVALVLVATTYALAHAASVDVAKWLLLIPVVLAATGLALGAPAVRVLAVPIGYFAFAVPVWTLANPFLQRLTAEASTLLLTAVGTRAHIEGDFVTVSAGTFEIAGGCSGINFLVVALATATFVAYTDALSRRRALVLVGVAAALAILANWVRVAVIIHMGDVTAMRSPLVRDHYSFGWWVYAATLVPLVLLARRFAGDPHAPAARPGRSVAAGAASWAVTGVAACLLALPALWETLIDRGTIRDLPAPVPPRLEGWSGPGPARRDWRPRFPGALVAGAWRYERGGVAVDTYVAAYGAQAPRRKLVGYPSSIAGEGAVELSATRVQRAGCDGDDEALVERRLRTRTGERLVWSWYEVHGARVASAAGVKARESLAAFGRRGPSAIVALSARCQADCASARTALASAYDAGFGRWRVAANSKNGAGERGNACRTELAGRSSR